MKVNDLILTNLDAEILVNKISAQVTANILAKLDVSEQLQPEKSILDAYIPKTEVRGVLASNSTLWQWEKSGKLKLYAIGGKRFYKRTDIENLFKEVNTTGNKKGGAK